MALWGPSMPRPFEPLQATSLGRQEENPVRLTDLPPEVLNAIFDHLFHDTIVHVAHECIDLPEFPQRNNINRPIHPDLQILLVCKSLSSQAMDSFLHAALFVCHYTACQKADVDVCLHSDSTIAAAKYFEQIRRFSTASHELLLYFGLIKFEEEIGFVTPYSQRTVLPESSALRELNFEFDMDVDIKRLRRQPPSIPNTPFRILSAIIGMLHDRKDLKLTLTIGVPKDVSRRPDPDDRKIWSYRFRIDPEHNVEMLEWPEKGDIFSTAILEQMMEWLKVKLRDEDVLRMKAINSW